ILSPEKSEDGSVDFLQGFGIGGEVAVVDDVGGERGLGERHVERVTAAHAPSNGTDAVFLTSGWEERNWKAEWRSRWARSSGTPRMISCASSGVTAALPR